MPFTYASIQNAHSTIAASPNVRMPNQSSAAEWPRFSESTSCAARIASGAAMGIVCMRRGAGISASDASSTNA